MVRAVPLGLAFAVPVLSLIAATALASSSFAQDRTVNVYNWSDYVEPTVIDSFTKATGIKVKYDTFDSNDMLETKLLAGRTGYDLVVPTAYFLAREIKAGVYTVRCIASLPPPPSQRGSSAGPTRVAMAQHGDYFLHSKPNSIPTPAAMCTDCSGLVRMRSSSVSSS